MAERLAAEEGLVLVPADNTTGFKGVYHYGESKSPSSHRSEPTPQAGLASLPFIGND